MLSGTRMHPRCRGSAGALKVTLYLALLAAPSCVFRQGFSLVSVPIPVDIDGQTVRCPLYLKLEMKSYNIPFDKFAAGSMDKAQTMFATAVEAIRKEDAAKFGSVWTPPEQMKRLGQTTVTLLSDNTPGGWIKVARSTFDFNKITVVAEVRVGAETMFIWDAPTEAGPRRRTAFYVGADQKNQTRLSIVSSAATVQELALNAFEAARTDPAAYKPLPNVHLRYQYPIPLSGKADSSAHSVLFEFDGAAIDFPLGDEKVKPPTPMLEFFRNATLAYESGNNDLYASSFTLKSQARLRPWLASMEKRRAQIKQQFGGLLRVQPENVKFVLSADPVYLVFEAPSAGSDWRTENLSYSYILHEGGGYKIANFSYLTDLDDFLHDPALFDRRILKPAPPKPVSRR